MFYLIQFDNIQSIETKQLQHNLSGYPNGTILSYSTPIRVSKLPIDKWIVWIDKNNVPDYGKQVEQFLQIKGIKSFIELDIQQSPKDINWRWDDNYLDSTFKISFVSSSESTG